MPKEFTKFTSLLKYFARILCAKQHSFKEQQNCSIKNVIQKSSITRELRKQNNIPESFWWPKMNNDVEDLVKACPLCQAVTPSQFELLNIHAVRPMGIFICRPVWTISNRWIHIYCHWCLFQVPRGCTPKGLFLKNVDKGIRVYIFQKWLSIDIGNRPWSEPCFSRNGKLFIL